LATRTYKLCELAVIVGGEVDGDGEVVIGGVAGIREAEPGQITFVANPKYAEYLGETRASAVIASRDLATDKPVIRSANPYFAYFQVLNIFAEQLAVQYPRGVHELAVVDATARIGKNVGIGPFCHIGRNVVIGDDTTLLAGTFVGEGSRIGERCLVYPQVTIREGCEIGNRVILQPGAVVGSDGFGYARNGATHHKVPQIGRVVIEDDVEVGANTCIDRATTGETRIKRGTKIDNLVQLAHNVVVGEHCILAAQVGISGSTELGNHVTLAGQAGLAGHIVVGDRAVVGGQGGVTKSVAADTVVSGYPAREHREAKRILAHTAALPDLFKRVKELEQRLRELEEGGAGGTPAKDNRK